LKREAQGAKPTLRYHAQPLKNAMLVFLS